MQAHPERRLHHQNRHDRRPTALGRHHHSRLARRRLDHGLTSESGIWRGMGCDTFFYSLKKHFAGNIETSFLFERRTRAKFHHHLRRSGMLPRRCRCRQRRERQAVMGGCATGQCAVGGDRLGALPRRSSGLEDRALACSCVRSTGADAELQRMRVGEGWCARRARRHGD